MSDKLVRRYHVRDATLHDSEAVDHLLMWANTGASLLADPVYRCEEIEPSLRPCKLTCHVHHKSKRSKPLTEQGKSRKQ